MAIVRRKSNGCRRGAFKKKPMGKGWAAHRATRGVTKPVVRIPLEGESAKKAEQQNAEQQKAEQQKADESNDSQD